MKMQRKIYLASDHRGVDLKSNLINSLKVLDLPFEDLGPNGDQSVDYPDYAQILCRKLTKNDLGVLICGSGNGMVIAANRYHNVRAALCLNAEMAVLARKHNDANILVLGADFIDYNEAISCLNVFIETVFEGGRHARRVGKINCGG